MMAVRVQLKEDFGTSSLAAVNRISLFPFASNGIAAARRRRAGAAFTVVADGVTEMIEW
jgi:hypothetical protein